MGKRAPRFADHTTYRANSGWWLAAWRDYVGMTLLELAEAMDTSKGQVSDLETGNGTARYNRDWVERAAKALSIPQGYLMDVNPFAADEVLERMISAYRDLEDDERATAAGMVELLAQNRRA